MPIAHQSAWTRIALGWVVLTLVSCSKPPASQTDMTSPGGTAASEEKVLHVYNWADFMSPEVIAAFSKETGIRVNYDVYVSEEMRETKLLAGHSNYDVVVPSGTYLEREIAVGIYQKIDPSRIPNLRNIDPEVQKALGVYDPGHAYGVGYTWFTTAGLGFDVAKLRARVPEAPIDSWRLFFDPSVLAKFADCGVALIDAPADVLTLVLLFLGRDPNSEKSADLTDAEKVLLSVRPYIRYIDTARYDGDLANGSICMALGWSGDIARAILRAKEAGTEANLSFSLPREGSVNVFDVLAIPADAPHPLNAHRFMDYLLRPDVAAINTNTTLYANVVSASNPHIEPTILSNPAVYPRSEVRAKLIPERPRSQAFTRLLTRTWTRFKTNR
jgi:putrescine transport system substrate-binding protein